MVVDVIANKDRQGQEEDHNVNVNVNGPQKKDYIPKKNKS